MLFWFHGDSRCSPVDPIHDDVTGELEVPMEENPEPWRIHPGSGPTLDLQGIDQKIPDLDFFWFDIWPTLLTLHWYHTITNYPMPLNTLFQIPTGVANHIGKTNWPENPCRIGWASEFPPLTGNSAPPAWWELSYKTEMSHRSQTCEGEPFNQGGFSLSTLPWLPLTWPL